MSELTGKYLGSTKIIDRGKNNKEFLTRSFFLDITDNSEYPNTPEFQLIKDKVTVVDELSPGDEITVFYNILGRKWEKDGKKGVYTSLQAWKIANGNNTNSSNFPGTQDEPAGSTDTDDLPF